MSQPDDTTIQSRYETAMRRRAGWENLWRDCALYGLPGRDSASQSGESLYDGTAADAVDQLAASLLAWLCPPNSQWFGLAAGPTLSPLEAEAITPLLEQANSILLGHFQRSNFAVELHQALLELVVYGTACLSFDESAPGSFSAFRFAAIPMTDLTLEEDADGRPAGIFRRSKPTIAQLARRFGSENLPPDLRHTDSQHQTLEVIDAVLPDKLAWSWQSRLRDSPHVLAERTLSHSPLIAFRWMKSPGEVYGRSPVMKALPDIRTANKVVELILKNASIAVTGIWMADDDGVLNPATIRLTPGSIIPKAVGSAGLTPLAMPSRFDVSQLVLSDLRGRIRAALLADRLGDRDQRMTATEIVTRTADTARILGATYGRLQSELLLPLIQRALAILVRRGALPDLPLDGNSIVPVLRSPLARAQARDEAEGVLSFLATAKSLGDAATDTINATATARWLANALGVPSSLLTSSTPPTLTETLTKTLTESDAP